MDGVGSQPWGRFLLLLEEGVEDGHIRSGGLVAARCADNVEEIWRSAKGTATTTYRVVAVSDHSMCFSTSVAASILSTNRCASSGSLNSPSSM